MGKGTAKGAAAAAGDGGEMVAANSGASALAMPAESAALAALFEGVDVGAGGLEEVGREDVKLAAKVWNFKGVDAKGDPIPANVFYDTIAETTSRELSLVPITLHKTNEWREYDEGEGVSKVRCRSFDQQTGTMEDGTERPCNGCPDAQWRTENGKRTRRCGPVYNVIHLERDTLQPCVLRFKKTSLPVIQGHLNKHHLGKMVQPGGKRGHVPLYTYGVKVSLKMSDDKKYAIPVIERGAMLSREEIEYYAESSKGARALYFGDLEKIVDRTERGADAGDGSFEFGANAGDKFADDSKGSAAAATAANPRNFE